MYLIILQRLFIEFLWHLIYFPIWWYTGGIKRIGIFCVELMRSGNDQLAPGLWLRNIFVPMFGQYDWQGRIMSFFMRLVNVIGRGTALAFWTAFVLAILVFWLVFPMFVLIMLGFSF